MSEDTIILSNPDNAPHLTEPKTHIECNVCGERMWINPNYRYKDSFMMKCTCGHYMAVRKDTFSKTFKA